MWGPAKNMQAHEYGRFGIWLSGRGQFSPIGMVILIRAERDLATNDHSLG